MQPCDWLVAGNCHITPTLTFTGVRNCVTLRYPAKYIKMAYISVNLGGVVSCESLAAAFLFPSCSDSGEILDNIPTNLM